MRPTDAATAAFMSGHSTALLVAAGIALAGAVAALVLVRSHAESSRPPVQPVEADGETLRAA